MDLTYSHQVLEQRLSNSTPLMVINQLIHQESGIANLQKFTSNTITLLPEWVLCFFFMGRLNRNTIDNGDVEVHTSDSSFESTSESVPYPDTTMVKSIDDDEMYHLLEFFHYNDDDDNFDVDLQMLQSWLMVAHSSKFYTVYTVFFHEYVA